jgi:D-arginine dehydrogenase
VTRGHEQLRCDVAIIGGGIAGAAAAWAIAPHSRVVLLEGESGLGYHSTGRSAAILTESYEAGLVRDLTSASRRVLTADFAAVDGLLVERGLLWVAGPGRDEEVERAIAAAEDGPAALELLDTHGARELCPALRPEACSAGLFERGAAAIDVDLLHQAYVRTARHHGAKVVTDARVRRIEHTENGWTVDATVLDVTARVLVDAAGAWADVVASMAGVSQAGLQPLRRTAFLFPARDGDGHERWPFTVGIDEAWYFEPHGPVLLGSNADEHPDVPRDARADDVDVAEAIEKINAATTLNIRRVLKQWAGLRTFAPDRLPVIGPYHEDPTFHWYAGLGGFGIMTSPALGRVVADAVLQRTPSDLGTRVLAALPAPRGGPYGLAEEP